MKSSRVLSWVSAVALSAPVVASAQAEPKAPAAQDLQQVNKAPAPTPLGGAEDSPGGPSVVMHPPLLLALGEMKAQVMHESNTGASDDQGKGGKGGKEGKGGKGKGGKGKGKGKGSKESKEE